MTMTRVVLAETLDGLAADDPSALRSHRDLRRIHRVMGTRAIVLRGLRAMALLRRGAAPMRVLELGAGDGSLMLGVARELGRQWPRVELTLLDRKSWISGATLQGYADAGWSATATVCDVRDWVAGAADARLNGSRQGRWDLIVANLFLHHFEGAQLAELLGAIAARTERFFACEPRRAWLSLAGSHLVGAIGANAVTRHDAVLSVHAGFRGQELTALWPANVASAANGLRRQLQEFPAGLFSHCFAAAPAKAS